MNKYRIVVSRYQSVSLIVEAEDIDKAEWMAHQAAERDGFFNDDDDIVEVIDALDEDQEPTLVKEEPHLRQDDGGWDDGENYDFDDYQ